MRRFGQLLLLLGLAVGLGSVVAAFLPWHLAGVAWLLGVGIVKLGLGSSLGLMAAGATMRRVAARRDDVSEKMLRSGRVG